MKDQKIKIFGVYGLAVLLTVAAAAIGWALIQQFGQLPTFITFYPAMIISVLVGGAGPGLLSTALGGLLASLFLPPIGSPKVETLTMP
jgi:hypothetical protein